MSINPVVACSLVIAALASAQGVSAQTRPAAPAGSAMATNVSATGSEHGNDARQVAFLFQRQRR
jgi:hypothetical protein